MSLRSYVVLLMSFSSSVFIPPAPSCQKSVCEGELKNVAVFFLCMHSIQSNMLCRCCCCSCCAYVAELSFFLSVVVIFLFPCPCYPLFIQHEVWLMTINNAFSAISALSFFQSPMILYFGWGWFCNDLHLLSEYLVKSERKWLNQPVDLVNSASDNKKHKYS